MYICALFEVFELPYGFFSISISVSIVQNIFVYGSMFNELLLIAMASLQRLYFLFG